MEGQKTGRSEGISKGDSVRAGESVGRTRLREDEKSG